MGYANPAQLTSGIHTRQYSRAFVIDDGTKRVVFASVDCAMLDQIVKTEVRTKKACLTWVVYVCEATTRFLL